MPAALSPTRPWRTLIFPAASEVGLEIFRALRDCKEVILHGAGLSTPSAADFHFRHLHSLPSIADPTCLAALQRLIHDQKIDAIFPAYDDVTLWLAAHAEHLNTSIITSPHTTVALCRSKKSTYAALANTIPIPKLWQANTPDISFPVFVKPDRGQGSQRARRIDDPASLAHAMNTEPDLLVMENLPGAEYTIDCFSQRKRGVLFAAARIREQTRSGIATRCTPVQLANIQDLANRIASKLELHGAWFFQLKADRAGELRLLEVAPRIAGSMALSRITGPNFPLLSLYEAAGFPLTIEPFPSTITMGRSLDIRFLYDQPIGALYLDLDDTLILRDTINPRLIALLFQCRNQAIPVHLITRHRGNLKTTLERYRLHTLFDRIIHITDDTIPKANYITETNAVLVDDSFQERAATSKQIGIRCFDAAAAICLLDERS
jgi:carbamoyl-phosphate synthase large subunit